jgi:HAD superfamily hydrolase (TIGR01490 family)
MGTFAHGRVAAFFDIDGTLVPRPSLERRLVRLLLWRRELRLASGLRWVLEAARLACQGGLAPQGASVIWNGNKMHLRGVRSSVDGLRFLLPRFFPQAVERAAQHAAAGHDIVLVSGTLEPLARMLGAALEAELRRLGCTSRVHICATQLEQSGGAWTGRVLGLPMTGKAKGQAGLRLARERGYDLLSSYVYADSASDRWLLAAVGHPAAVNPARRLARIARARGWPVLRWSVEWKGRAAQQDGSGFAPLSFRQPVSRSL